MSALKKGENHPLFGKNHSEKTRAKISGIHKGRILSEKTRAKISAANQNPSEETRSKMSASKMGNSNGKNQPNSLKIEVTDFELNTKTTFGSICEAARALNCDHSSITSYFRRNQKKPFRGRYVFTKI